MENSTRPDRESYDLDAIDRERDKVVKRMLATPPAHRKAKPKSENG